MKTKPLRILAGLLVLYGSVCSEAQLPNSSYGKCADAEVLQVVNTKTCDDIFAVIDSTINVNKARYVIVDFCGMRNEKLISFNGNWNNVYIVATTSDAVPVGARVFSYRNIDFLIDSVKIPPVLKRTGGVRKMVDKDCAYCDPDNMTVIEVKYGCLKYISKYYIDIYRTFYE